MDPDLTDDEVDRICAGYKQNAAKVRYLQGLGVRVERKPNGRPLVCRAHYEAVRGNLTPAPAAPATSAAPHWKVAA